jgi:flagella synthesis protein FlgN
MELPRTLQSLHHHLGLLVGLLQQEQSTLLNPQSRNEDDGELLQRLAQDKQEQFQVLEGFESYRGELQEALGDITSTEPTSKQAGDNLSLWVEVRELALQASRLNQLNGVLIRHRLIHNQRVLNSLRQLGGPMLYDAGGNAAAFAGRLSSVA